ncbi:MAG: type IV pilus assembly protein PilM [Candidatus Pacebacteria bacterium]|nr:type IV pilus assembly protein PilM [Candidatus Paceibacterota bacterium]
MDFFGLDIGSHNLKLVQLKKQKDKFKVVALGLAPTPKSLESEAESDLVGVAEGIKRLITATKVSCQYVVSALPEDKVFTRVVEFPQMKEKELESALKWEAEQYVPIPLSEAVIDYQIITETGKSKTGQTSDKLEAFLVAAPKSLVNKYVRVMNLAGLKLVSLETEMVSLSRSLVMPSSVPTMIIDLGARATDIALVVNEQIVLTRSLSNAGETITRALVNALGLKANQAEEYKKAYGVDESKLEGKIRQAVGPVLDVVISEIEKTITFYKTRSKPLPVERVMLTGGTAHLPQIVHLFAERLGIEVEVGNPFQRILEAQEVLTKLGKNNTPMYSIAFGLAMKNL